MQKIKNKKMKQLKWTTTVQYIDKETGEMIPKEWIGTHYEIVKKIKIIKKENYANFQTREGHTQGRVEITNECRRRPQQGKLF